MKPIFSVSDLITTKSYGIPINTVPYFCADKNLLTKLIDDKVLINALSRSFNLPNMCGCSQKTNDQKLFLTTTVDCLNSIMSEKGHLDLFSDIPDHLNRPMGRYIMRDVIFNYNYIIDIFATLDVNLVLSSTKRFILTHVPRKWAKVDFSQMDPRIIYKIRIWNTPVSYYLISVCEDSMGVPYTSKIENARSKVGVPQIYNHKELKLYERIDYDIRRAIFNEVIGLPKK